MASGGYWFVASDGGIFSFGAPFLGSAVAPAPAAPAPAPGSPSCSVSMSVPNPPQYSYETANVQSNVPNTPVSITAYYRTTTSMFGGGTDDGGSAAVPFYISGATHGYTVVVTANVGSASCLTSFTTQ